MRNKKRADGFQVIKTSCTSEVIHKTAVMDHIQSAGGNSENRILKKLADLCQEVGYTGLT